MAGPARTDTRAGSLGYATAAGRWVIAATVLGSGIASLDATVVGIALPVLGRDFGIGVGALQWIVNAYTLTLSGLLLLGGTLGDRYGRRRVFLAGVTWFAVASLGCALAPTAPTLIVARGFQGVGAALLMPGSLAILQASFVPEDRGKAIGAWSALGGLATAIGPFVGGWLIGAVSWRLVFFINLPLAAAVLLIGTRHVPESHAPATGTRLDVPGATAITGGLMGVTYGLIEGPTTGWTAPTVLGALIAGTALVAAFLLIEHRSPDAMLALGIFASRQFSAANAVTFVVYAALGGALFLLPIMLEEVAGYGPLAAGASLLPVTALMLAFSSRSGALAARIGPRLQMSVGPVVIAAGLALLVRIDATGGYWGQVFPAVVVFGAGLAINVAPLTTTALAAAPAGYAGIASAVNNDVARAAGLIAVAVLPVVAGITGDAYLDPAAMTRGFRTAVLIAAAACAVGGMLAAGTIRNPIRAARATAGQHDRETSCGLDAPPLRGTDHFRPGGYGSPAPGSGPVPTTRRD